MLKDPVNAKIFFPITLQKTNFIVRQLLDVLF
jgi:hypothetical protein